MPIYIRNGEHVSREDFYRSKYNDVFISVYNANPDNLQKAVAEIKTRGCLPVEACGVLAFVLGVSLREAHMAVQEFW
jgi:hypothetical protein